MGVHSPDASKADIVFKEQALLRLENLIIRGTTNQSQLAAAFGVCQATITNWINEIYQRWAKTAGRTTEDKRALRVKQLESIAMAALNEFESSRKNAEELGVVSRRCLKCNNGIVKVNEYENAECKECGGVGEVEVVNKRVRGRTGDPAYLTVAKTCIEAAAKLEGLYPETAKISKTIIEEGRTVGGEIQRRIEEVYLEAPVDLIIKSKAILDKLRVEGKKAEQKVIEVEGKKVDE